MIQKLKLSLFAYAFFYLASCTNTVLLKDFNGTTTSVGKPKYYQVTNNTAIHLLLGFYPVGSFMGDATFPKTLDSFTKEAKKNKTSKVNIFHKETTKLWYVLPPLSLFFTPVNTELIGNIEE
jgi:hypothetical protein